MSARVSAPLPGRRCIAGFDVELRHAGFRIVTNPAAVRGTAEDTTCTALAQMREAGAEFITDAGELPALTEKPRS